MILDLFCIAILIGFIAQGMKRGGVKAIIETLSFFITIAAVMFFKEKITGLILSLEPVMNWIEALSAKLNTEILSSVVVSNGFAGDLASAIVSIIVNSLSFIITYIIIKLILKALLGISDMLTSLPIIKPLNRVIGGVVGGAKAIIVVWIIMVAMLLSASSDFYQLYTSAISDSFLTEFLYNNNIFFRFF